MADILLEVSDLRTWFPSEAATARVVDGASFSIRKGETFALLGESGCGKSMTSLSIMRLLPAAGRNAGGSVCLNGADLLALPEYLMRAVRGRRIGMIFQEPMSSLNPVMTVGAQIQEAVTQHLGFKGKAAKQRVVKLLTDVGIPDPQQRYHEFPHQLSGGMKQRVVIAIALAGEPELLIADEPTTALDVTIQAQVLELLRKLQREHGMAILLITHDLGVVAEMADHVSVMYAGQIVEQATRAQFFADPRHPYSRKLFQSLPDISKRGVPLAQIPGTVPPLTSEFLGCRFVDRCEFAWAACSQHVPALIKVEQGEVRCHLYDVALDIPKHQDSVVNNDVPASPVAMMVQGAPLLQVSALKVHFPIHKGLFQRVVGRVYAVDGIDMALHPGRTLALVGESGCGKTTVGKAILQLQRPTAGQVRFDGIDLSQLSERQLRPLRGDFQIIFQDPYSSLNPRMRVAEIIAEGMQAQGKGGDAAGRQARVDQLLAQVGLRPEHKYRYPHEFSGGQRQRICIARALAVEPKLIVCDEPTSALDVSVQAQILNLLKSLQQELGLSYLFITHNISVVSYLAHDVAVMYLGRIVEFGPVEQVLSSPSHPYTQILLSAVPTIHPHQGRSIQHLSGELPSPINPPQGCHFHPRCPMAIAACHQAYPEPVLVGEGHVVRCVRAVEMM